MEASTKIVRGDENVVGALGPIPKRVFGGDEVDRGGQKRPSVADGWEAIDGAEVAGDIDWDEEEVGLVRVKGTRIAGQQGFMYGHLRSEQMVAAPLVCHPICVVFWWQIVHKNLQIIQ